MGFSSGEENVVTNYGGTGAGVGGGSWSMIILVVVVLWLLFKDGNHNVVNGHGFCQDETNYQVDERLSDLGAAINQNVTNQGYEMRLYGLQQSALLQANIAAENEKTRDLITHNQERADDRAYQALMMSNMQKDAIIQTQAIEANVDSKFNQVFAAIAATNQNINQFACETPKRPQYLADGFYATPRRSDCGC